MAELDLVASLQARATDITETCTTCGSCFEACPMTAPAGIAAANPGATVGGILDLLAGGEGTAEALRWANVCNGSGFCIPACPEGINTRFMVQLARGYARRQAGEQAVRRVGRDNYANMARSARILSRLQLTPEDAARLTCTKPEADAPPPEVVFYTGCNIAKTPHIALLMTDILDAIGVRYAVAGGTGNCCGVHQHRAGDFAAQGRMGFGTAENLAAHGAPLVLSWCPSCQIQFGENTLPSYAAIHGAVPFEMAPVLPFLAARAEQLRPLMIHPVRRRVAIHERPALPEIMVAVRTLLGLVPGLEVVEVPVPRIGVMAIHVVGLPDYKRDLLTQEFAEAKIAGADTLATVFHACHREICHLGDASFEVVNFLELIGESMGIAHTDLYRRLRLLDDVDAVIMETAPMAAAHGLDLDTVRTVLLAEFG
jgi:heterodisulfide reductase subunit D